MTSGAVGPGGAVDSFPAFLVASRGQPIYVSYRAFVRGGRLMGIKSGDLWAHLDVLDDVIPNRRIILRRRPAKLTHLRQRWTS